MYTWATDSFGLKNSLCTGLEHACVKLVRCVGLVRTLRRPVALNVGATSAERRAWLAC
jgi:hypothetical protein